MIKRLITLLIICALGACSSDNQAPLTEQQRPVKVLKIADNNKTKHIYPAKLISQSQADLSFRISGELINIALIEGQRVERGELLAQIDPSDALNQLAKAKADYALAQAEYQRIADIYQEALTSKAEFERAQAKHKSAKALLQAAQNQLKYTEIRAPFSGVIAKIWLDNHQLVRAGEPVISVHDADNLEAIIQVPAHSISAFRDSSSLLSSLTIENAAPISVNFYELSSKINSASQTYSATFRFQAPQQSNAIPGMTAQLTVILPMQASTLIPISALLKDDHSGESFVWVLPTGATQAQNRPVKIDRLNTDGIEILEGIQAGERVIIAGAQQITGDMRLKELSWQRGI